MKEKLFKSIIKETAFYMVIVGLIMGVSFMPISHLFIGLPLEKVYSFDYGFMCIAAGLFVSVISFLTVKAVVLNRLENFSNNINTVTQNIMSYKRGDIENINECENCYIRLYSRDVLGVLAGKYNALVRVIRSLFWQYEQIDKFFFTLNKSLELETLDKSITEFICSITSALGIELYHLDKELNLHIGYAKGVKTKLNEERKKSLVDIILNGKVVELNKNEVEFIEFGTVSIKPYEIAYFPFNSEETQNGVVVLYTTTYLSKNMKNLVLRLLQEYSLALKSSLTYEKMQKMAAFDELTNLYNRRFGLKRLKEEYQRSKRSKGCLCVLMFDIDHFKRVNDTYGHQAGDFILSSFANILQQNFREEDVVMRYGGEEFICALSNANMDDSYKRAEIIRKQVEDSVFTWKDVKIKITVSCGVDSFEAKKEDKSIEDIIKNADEKLYIAKNTGRNRCILSS